MQREMLKQTCLQMGFAGTFSKLRYVKQLLLQRLVSVRKLRHIPICYCRFSTTNTSLKSAGHTLSDSIDVHLDGEKDSLSCHTTKEEMYFHENEMHIPVMLQEVKKLLVERAPKTILDMTFGAGGHSKALLHSLPDCKILALDRDPYAYKLAQELASESSGRVIPLLGRFSDLSELLTDLNIPPDSIDGVLFDLGSSSMQFDQPERGFSLSRSGPLDMRMDGDRIPSQPTAADVVNLMDEVDIAKILKKYGDENRSKKIAHAIVEARSAFGKITTTGQLAAIISSIFPGSYGQDSLNRFAHPATKTFMALRIFVNNELNELHNGLELVNKYLRPGGICMVIAFHSLEDRIVKRNFHYIDLDLENNMSISKKVRMKSISTVYSREEMGELMKIKWKPMSKKVIVPSAEEVDENPRSRSAKLRAAFKVS